MRTSLLIVVVTMVISVIAMSTMALQGAFQPINNITDPHIQELGAWAVSVHNRQANAGLKFNRVIGGQYQVVSGTRYHLIIDASNPNGKYMAWQMLESRNGPTHVFSSPLTRLIEWETTKRQTMRSILFFLVSAMVIYYAAAAPITELEGTFDPVEEIKAPHIQELGAWAVAEYDRRANVGLKFNRVVSAKTQVMIGIRYNLIINASEPHGQYVADLGEPDESDARILFSFRPVT
ncbi:hypothetical protein EJB05_07609, partial [Eragrostis curvula]